MILTICVSLSLRFRLFSLLQQILAFLCGDGLCARLFRPLPRVFSLLPVYLVHLLNLSLMLLLLALFLLVLQFPLYGHLALLDLLRGGLSKCYRA